MAREKTTGFFFKMSPEENELFERNMVRTGIKNKSAFIRKMCIDGHVFNIESETLSEIKRLLGISTNNLNQLTRRVNSGGDAPREDVEQLNGEFKEIRLCFGEALIFLSNIATAKPGKRFLRPPTVRDLPEYAELTTGTEDI